MSREHLLILATLVACRQPPPDAAWPVTPPVPYAYPHRYAYPGSSAAPAPPSAPTIPYLPPHGPPPTRPALDGGPRHGQNHALEIGPPGGPFQAGEASYYHDSLAGRSTASGAPYDPTKLTAAHRSLAFGTVVDVVRNDGRWVRVTINDRGPYHGGRVIDLSRHAAKKLGLMRRGVAQVRLFVVSKPD